ncbi:hypothetical protein IIA15_09620 [candidate division TA06 bacterium]|nr:hypothetical protein [candidate division TA06 bacterium]
MRAWLNFLKSNLEARADFLEHMKSLGDTALAEEHTAKEWADVKEARGKKTAYDYLLSFYGKEERREEQYHNYLKAVKGK